MHVRLDLDALNSMQKSRVFTEAHFIFALWVCRECEQEIKFCVGIITLGKLDVFWNRCFHNVIFIPIVIVQGLLLSRRICDVKCTTLLRWESALRLLQFLAKADALYLFSQRSTDREHLHHLKKLALWKYKCACVFMFAFRTCSLLKDLCGAVHSTLVECVTLPGPELTKATAIIHEAFLQLRFRAGTAPMGDP